MTPEARARLEAAVSRPRGTGWPRNDDVRDALATIDAQAARVRELERIIETALNYTGPKWPDEMSLHEKLCNLYTGNIHWPRGDAKTGSAG